MSTIIMGSYTTTVSRSPVLLPGSSLLMRGRGSWRPAVALRPSAAVKCRRPLSVTCALPDKERPPAFSIPPTALLCPVPPPDGKERWDIKEEKDSVMLWLQVPGLSADDIEVRVTAGEDVLEIKRKVSAAQPAAPLDAHGVGAFHIRLLMTKEYNGSGVTADLKAGMLEVTVPKNTERGDGRFVMGGPGGNESTNKASASSSSEPKPGPNKPAQQKDSKGSI